MAFLLVNTFGRRYEDAKRRMWGGTPAFDLAPITVASSDSTAEEVAP